MEIDDLVLVSVDDHVVEPPDMFEAHLPEKWRDVAPRMVRRRSVSEGSAQRCPRSQGSGASTSV